jgi:hypothetical protein
MAHTKSPGRDKADWNLPIHQLQLPHAVRFGKSAARQLHYADDERRNAEALLDNVLPLIKLSLIL